MNRRSILKSLLLAAPIGVAANTPPASDALTYKGYSIKWRDYVSDTTSDRLFGAWIAVKPDHVISSPAGGFPGWGRHFMMGRDDLSVHSSTKELESAKARALADLKLFIDSPIGAGI